MLPPEQPTKPEDVQEDKLVSSWTRKFQKAEKFLEPWFERDQQAYEFWYMWREFRGPYRSNIFPPDVHAAVESVVPRLTKGRPRPVVKGGRRIPAELAMRVQRGHAAYWDIMGMDDKWETLTKRGAWFGAGYEKLTWRTTLREEPVMQEQPEVDETTGEVIGRKQVPVMIGEEVKNPDGTTRIEQRPMTRPVPEYHAPFSEICDPARVFFPRGYAREEDLPWVIFQYFKRLSELDPEIYDEDKLQLLKTSGKSAQQDITLDRDKVHRLPRRSQVLGQTDSDNAHETDASGADDDEEDPIVELWEIYERPNRLHPNGQCLTIGNRKVVVRDLKKNPTPEGELPLVVFSYIEDTFNLRGVGLARELERLTLERADKRNQRMDNVSNAIDSMGFLQASEDVEDSEFEHRPNGIVRLQDVNSYRPREVRDVTQNAYREDEMIQADEAKATGANEYVVGGGKRQDEALGQTDLLVSSSNERYDGVIRRLERSLDRHARLVHLYVRQNAVDTQELEWTDASGEFQEDDFSPDDFAQVDPRRVHYDAKSVIAYKELSRKQGLQLMEMMGKLLSEDPRKLQAMKPVWLPLLELYDEIKVNPTDLVRALDEYSQQRLAEPPLDVTGRTSAEGSVVPLDEPTPDQSATLAGVNKL